MSTRPYSVGDVHPTVERADPLDRMYRVHPQPPSPTVQRPEHQKPVVEHRDQPGIVTSVRAGYSLIQSTTLGWRFPSGTLPAGIRRGDQVVFDVLRDPYSSLRSAVNVRPA